MTNLERVLEELRSSFDRSFQEPIRQPGEPPLLLLAIAAAGARFALGVDELAGVSRLETVVPIPCNTAALMGLTAIRGRLVSAYSLAALLGYGEGGAKPESWIALCSKQPAVGIAFAKLEGNLLLPRSDLRPVAPGAPCYAVASIGAGADGRWVLSVPAISDFLTSRREG